MRSLTLFPILQPDRDSPIRRQVRFSVTILWDPLLAVYIDHHLIKSFYVANLAYIPKILVNKP